MKAGQSSTQPPCLPCILLSLSPPVLSPLLYFFLLHPDHPGKYLSWLSGRLRWHTILCGSICYHLSAPSSEHWEDSLVWVKLVPRGLALSGTPQAVRPHGSLCYLFAAVWAGTCHSYSLSFSFITWKWGNEYIPEVVIWEAIPIVVPSTQINVQKLMMVVMLCTLCKWTNFPT